MAKRSGKTEHEMLCETGEGIARELKIPETRLRYAKFVFHNGTNWTLSHKWQKLVDGDWVDVDLGEWQEMHST